ncbi:hypothetical protein DES39_0349 [Orbus hercynius]|uniref:Gp37 protein n=1 Tax=Orbus hercynius TaxID=593135 RepID=A0A495RIN1_9GAMM|nr:hypothetical protein [Orbus hercynius]RKS87134.1 hypothetical protein DES39_0349 [Orbus hercynius]
MLDLRTVFQRLKEQVEGYEYVGDALDLANVQKTQYLDKTAVYLEVKSIRASTDSDKQLVMLKGKTRQSVVMTFAVTIVAKNHRYQSAPISSDLESVLPQIRQALIGWHPTLFATTSCQLLSGEMQCYNEQLQIWQDVYQVGFAIGSNR